MLKHAIFIFTANLSAFVSSSLYILAYFLWYFGNQLYIPLVGDGYSGFLFPRLFRGQFHKCQDLGVAVPLDFIQCPFPNQTSLVWKSYAQKLRTIFQTNSSLVWKEKIGFCKTQIPNQIQVGLENFEDHCQCHENSNQI